jgi:hypothetical protein
VLLAPPPKSKPPTPVPKLPAGTAGTPRAGGEGGPKLNAAGAIRAGAGAAPSRDGDGVAPPKGGGSGGGAQAAAGKVAGKFAGSGAVAEPPETSPPAVVGGGTAATATASAAPAAAPNAALPVCEACAPAKPRAVPPMGAVGGGGGEAGPPIGSRLAVFSSTGGGLLPSKSTAHRPVCASKTVATPHRPLRYFPRTLCSPCTSTRVPGTKGAAAGVACGSQTPTPIRTCRGARSKN